MIATQSDHWAPVVELNLETASASAFADTIATFYEWVAKQPPPGPLAMQNGWHIITPQVAEDFLRRNRTNRKVSLQTVRKYYFAMKNGDWRRTGQPLIINKEGKSEDLQHRSWASYLGRVNFDSFVVTDAPADPDLFAFIDDCKPRSAADALHTSGMNGLAPMIAGAIKLAWKYDNYALAIIKPPRLAHDMTIREVLDYARANGSIEEAAHILMGNYPKAVSIVGNKPVALFFAWKVIQAHGVAALDEFLPPLGTGANLEEDSPILALRNRLITEHEEEAAMNQPRRLALLIKAFKLHQAGKSVGRGGLSLRDNEKYPRFDEAAELPLAAE